MASWVLAHPPWQSLARVRFRWDHLVKAGGWTSRQFLNTPTSSTDVETPMMREIKAYPYPTSSPDASLFEDPTEDYYDASEGISTTHDSTPVYPCSILKNLVMEGKYEDAERVHTELVRLGVEVRPHPIYHHVARHLLASPGIPSHARLDAFVKWWSLVPPRSEVDSRRSVGFILTETLRKDFVPDIPLIARFALLAASKGYAQQVAQDVITTLARYAPPQFTIKFLEDFCVSEWNYERSSGEHKHSPRDALQVLLRRDFKSWYSHAIHAFALANDFGPAVDAFKIAVSRQFFIRTTTYHLLRQKIRSSSDTQLARDVEALWEERCLAVGESAPNTIVCRSAFRLT